MRPRIIFNTLLTPKSAVIATTFVFLLLSRLLYADVLPAALTHDELVYAAQAKAMAITGKTIDQQQYPWSLQPLHPMYAELPGVLMVPFFWLFDNPLLATRGLSLVFGMLFPLVLSWFFYEWFKSKKIAYISLILASVNPLLWQMSRLMYDAPFSVFFYLVGGVVFLKAKSKVGLVVSLFALLMGFFGYQGYKLLFLPWIALLVWKKSQGSVKNLNKPEQLFGVLCLGVFLFYSFIMLPNQHVDNRFSNTIFASTDYLSSQVNEERRLSLNNPLIGVFSNKFTVATKFMVEKFVNAFNSNTIFWAGEPAQSKFAVWGHGWFYVTDLLLLVVGLISLGFHKRFFKPGLALLCFVVIATLPSLINAGNSWYLLRMFFPNVLLLGILSLGVGMIGKSRLLLGLFAGACCVSVVYFAYYYYFRYPILGQNTSYLSERIIIEYINRLRETDSVTPMYVHTVDVPVMLWSYLVYSDHYSKENASDFAAAAGSDHITINNVTFTTQCADPNAAGITINESWRKPCEAFLPDEDKPLSIPSVVDNGTYWDMYNDTLCEDFASRPYVTVSSMSDFDLGQQSNEKFCNQWLVRFN